MNIKLAPLYEKITNTIAVTLTDIDNTGGLRESPALQFLYDSIEGFYAITLSIQEAMKENEEDVEYEICRTLEVITSDIQGRTPAQKALMKWIRTELFERDPMKQRTRQKRSTSMVRLTQLLRIKLGIDLPEEPGSDTLSRTKILYILALPLVMFLKDLTNYWAKSSTNGLKGLALVSNILAVLSELRALANTRATIRDITMLQIRRGITDNFLADGRKIEVVNDAISALVNQYQSLPDKELKNTIENTLGTKEQMLKYLSIQE